jgi:hypothetical protein
MKERTMNPNLLQAQCIRRFRNHLHRIGRAVTLEDAACIWISRYARLWREHHNIRRIAA